MLKELYESVLNRTLIFPLDGYARCTIAEELEVPVAFERILSSKFDETTI